MSYPDWTARGAGADYHRGLAPLGLEPVAGRLIDRLMPGLNNVTWRVRYYSFFSWALWSFLEHTRDRPDARTNRAQARWLVRMENVFRLATLHADGRDGRRTWGLVGIDRAGPRGAPGSDQPDVPVNIAEEYAATAFVPAAYKASFTGLGCAESYPDYVELTTRTGLPLARAFHESVLAAPDAEARRMLLSGAEVVPARVIHALADAVRMRAVPAPSAENQLLTDLLFRVEQPREREDLQALDRRRTRSFTLLLHILEQAGRPLAQRDFHRVFAGGHLPDGRPLEVPRQLRETWSLWRGYQEREFQRVALYGLLHAIIPLIQEQETRLGGATARSLADAMWKAAQESEVALRWLDVPLAELTVGQAQRALIDRLDRTGVDAEWSVESLASYVSGARQRSEVVAGSLLLFLLVTAYWNEVQAARAPGEREIHEAGRIARLSLAHVTRETAARSGDSLRALTDWLVETCVLSQLLSVAVQKLAADPTAYRFFVAMGDEGYTIVKAPADGRFYYPPRIGPALHMLSELDLLDYGAGDEVSLRDAGARQLATSLRFLQDQGSPPVVPAVS